MRLSLGGGLTVTATEKWLSEIRAGRAFAKGRLQAAVASENSHVQLKNPAASGKTAIVRSVLVSTPTAMLVSFQTYDTDLTTDVGAGRNLLSDGANGVAHIRSQTNIGVLGTKVGELHFPANHPLSIAPEWLWEMGDGEGILVVGGTVNVALSALFMWIEV
jgi:hypothetical protein